jgi:hypothetical protein
MKLALSYALAALTSLGGTASAGAVSQTDTISRPQARLIETYTDFAGSEANATSLVTGLRHGGEVTLIEPVSGGPPLITKFAVPTRPMGNGNVSHSLALARYQLATYGIDQPTPGEIHAALNGGSIKLANGDLVNLPGVLQLRADGMGWGKIANSMGVKLGHVVSAAKHGPSHPASTAVNPRASGAVTTAAGPKVKSLSPREHVRSTGHVKSGIVTAAGTPVTAAGAQARQDHAGGSGAARGAGIVTAAGAAPGSHASPTGRAHGKGQSKP